MKITKNDKKIIYLLSQNARNSNSQIAKTIGISRQLVKKRIDLFLENKIIENFQALYNLEKLGFETAIILINSNDIKNLKKTLKEIKQINYVSENYGKWNFLAYINYKNIKNLHSKIEIIKEKCKIFEIEVIFYEDKFNYSSLFLGFFEEIKIKKTSFSNLSFQKELNSKRKTEKLEFKNQDKLLLKELLKNSRIEIKKISQILKKDTNTIKKNIQKLIEYDYIKGFYPTFKQTNLGCSNYFLLIKTKPINKIEEKKIILKLYKNKNIGDITYSVTNYNYIIELYTLKEQKFDKIAENIFETFREYLIDSVQLTVKEEIKFERKIDFAF